MQRKLGILSDCIVGEHPLVTLERVKDHGFNAFFSSCAYLDLPTVSALQDKAQKLGLSYEFMHGPFFGVNGMWTEAETPNIHREMLQAIETAAKTGVKRVIAHVSSSFTPPPVNDLGLRRFDEWVELAEKKGVVLAFENLRKLGNLACLMDRYEQSAAVKFCYDCGHEHCFTVTVPFLALYGDRVACTHIHDNLGRDYTKANGGDLHRLPFDGEIDYQRMMQGLNAADYTGALTLEVDNKHYQELTADAFLRTAYERLERLSKL
ncbi:MAG: sugar phosphate isomerase/epimerase [Clostridia bacterium]|nr:sugar phosphate isomerase/epimerase [Clostridia bacterium]